MMEFALFDTAIGRCGIGWTEAGIRLVQLPELSPHDTRRTIARQCVKISGGQGCAVEVSEVAAAPSARDVMARIAALLDGVQVSFSDVVLDVAGVSAFNQRVYQLTRGIPVGSTLCYGDIAMQLGAPGSARAVGRALGENPYPIVVPCHRVVAADGSMHGFSAPGGVVTKRRMLQIEGALPADEPTLFDP